MVDRSSVPVLNFNHCGILEPLAFYWWLPSGDKTLDSYYNNKYLKRDDADYDLLNRSCGKYIVALCVVTVHPMWTVYLH